MKRLLLIGTFTLLFATISEAGKVDAQITLTDGDEMNVTIKIRTSLFGDINFIALQKKITYYKDGKKHKLSPKEVKKVHFSYHGEPVTMMSVNDDLNLNSIFSGNENILLRMISDGDVQLFKYYYKQQAPGMYNGATGAVSAGYSYNVDRYILKKNGDTLKRPRALTFKRDMSEYFNDCPELSNKIADKEFKARDIELIVGFYNNHCN